VMERCLIALAAGSIHNPLRMIVRPPGASGLLGLMPAYLGGDEAVFGVKAVCVFPGNPAIGKDAHQGAVVLFSGETGEPLAVMNASAITAIRTAAVSAVATRALARPDSRTVAIIGAGVQARAHVRSVAEVLPLERIVVAGRDPERLHRMVDETAPGLPFPLEPASSAEAAVRDADVVVTVTSSPTPVIDRSWLAPGTHVVAVGSSIPTAQEIDAATMAAARVFVDRTESTVNESGDYRAAVAAGAIAGPEHIAAELGDVLSGRAHGRRTEAEITLFESLGLAAEDLAAARHLLSVATNTGYGTWIEL
jgi:ornithine cyclodeaminase/alanine dehydrogenase-like protein (mu-crystallin family)